MRIGMLGELECLYSLSFTLESIHMNLFNNDRLHMACFIHNVI